MAKRPRVVDLAAGPMIEYVSTEEMDHDVPIDIGGAGMSAREIDSIFDKLKAKLKAERKAEGPRGSGVPTYTLLDDLKLAEHKIDQHLQGQYNNPPYPALGVALACIRRALLKVEHAQE